MHINHKDTYNEAIIERILYIVIYLHQIYNKMPTKKFHQNFLLYDKKIKDLPKGIRNL